MNIRLAGVICGILGVVFFTTVCVGYTYENLPSDTGVSFTNIVETVTNADHALFGSPIRSGNKLYFIPSGFSASSSNGIASPVVSSQMTMYIEAPDDAYLDKIVITEKGDYILTGEGTSQTQAHVGGGAFYVVLDPWDDEEDLPEGQLLGVTPSNGLYTLPDPRTGLFTGRFEFDFSGMGIKKIAFTFNNQLSATSEANTSSFIAKKSTSEGVSLEVIPTPEPVSLVLLAMGGLFIRRR